MNRYLSIVLCFVGAILIGRFDTHDGRCESAYLKHGLTMTQCPSGTIRQTANLDVANVRRGADATLTLQAFAHYTIASADAVQTMPVPEIKSVTLTLDSVTPIADSPRCSTQ